MRFKDFLSEEKFSIKGFEKNLQLMATIQRHPYRGMDLHAMNALPTIHVSENDMDFAVYKIKARTEKRHSITGSDYYMTMVSEWKNFPPRNESSFFTTSSKLASEFGQLTLIVPADSVNLYGHTPKDFNYLIPDTDIFYHLNNVIKTCEKIITKNTNDTIDIIKNAIEESNAEFVKNAGAFLIFSAEQNRQCGHLIDLLLSQIDNLKKCKDGGALVNQLLIIRNEIKRFNLDTCSECIAWFENPDNLEATSFKNLKQVIEAGPSTSEIWFKGDYLAITDTEFNDVPLIIKHLLDTYS